MISHICVNGKTVVRGSHDLMNFSDIGAHIQVPVFSVNEEISKKTHWAHYYALPVLVHYGHCF